MIIEISEIDFSKYPEFNQIWNNIPSKFHFPYLKATLFLLYYYQTDIKTSSDYKSLTVWLHSLYEGFLNQAYDFKEFFQKIPFEAFFNDFLQHYPINNPSEFFQSLGQYLEHRSHKKQKFWINYSAFGLDLYQAFLPISPDSIKQAKKLLNKTETARETYYNGELIFFFLAPPNSISYFKDMGRIFRYDCIEYPNHNFTLEYTRKTYARKILSKILRNTRSFPPSADFKVDPYYYSGQYSDFYITKSTNFNSNSIQFRTKLTLIDDSEGSRENLIYYKIYSTRKSKHTAKYRGNFAPKLHIDESVLKELFSLVQYPLGTSVSKTDGFHKFAVITLKLSDSIPQGIFLPQINIYLAHGFSLKYLILEYSHFADHAKLRKYLSTFSVNYFTQNEAKFVRDIFVVKDHPFLADITPLVNSNLRFPLGFVYDDFQYFFPIFQKYERDIISFQDRRRMYQSFETTPSKNPDEWFQFVKLYRNKNYPENENEDELSAG